MSWEVFRAKGKTALGHLPVVGVHKGGRFSLNQAAYEALGQPALVELLFDESTVRMGMRAAGDEDRHAYSLKQPAGTSRYYITATSFARHYGINPDKTYERDAVLEGDVLACAVDATSDATNMPGHAAAPAVGGAVAEPSPDFDPDEEFAPSPPASVQEIDPDDIPF